MSDTILEVRHLSKAFGGQMTAPANGWAEAMLSTQIPFDVLLPEQVASGRLAEYRVAVLPTCLLSTPRGV